MSEEPVPESLPAPTWLSEHKPIPKSLESTRATLEAAALLGKRTAELHLALAKGTDLPSFAPEPLLREDLARDFERIEAQIKSVLSALKFRLPKLEDSVCDRAALLLSRRLELIQRTRLITTVETAGQRIRIHGDYHLGQTLRVTGLDAGSHVSSTGSDFMLIDFEGEPARPIQERRRKQSPLKDVVGMMRSFSYAAFSSIDRAVAAGSGARPAVDRNAMAGWAKLWQHTATAEFLSAYRDGMAANPALLPPPAQAQILLDAYLLEKALYEVQYELDNRPAWIHIPINSILTL